MSLHCIIGRGDQGLFFPSFSFIHPSRSMLQSAHFPTNAVWGRDRPARPWNGRYTKYSDRAIRAHRRLVLAEWTLSIKPAFNGALRHYYHWFLTMSVVNEFKKAFFTWLELERDMISLHTCQKKAPTSVHSRALYTFLPYLHSFGSARRIFLSQKPRLLCPPCKKRHHQSISIYIHVQYARPARISYL